MVSDKLIDRILKAIDRNELIGLAADLVRTNSVWDPVAGTGEKSVAEMIAQWLKNKAFRWMWMKLPRID